MTIFIETPMPTKIRIKEINFSLRKDIYQEATANIKLHSETAEASPLAVTIG